jgi:fucose permease
MYYGHMFLFFMIGYFTGLRFILPYAYMQYVHFYALSFFLLKPHVHLYTIYVIVALALAP